MTTPPTMADPTPTPAGAPDAVTPDAVAPDLKEREMDHDYFAEGADARLAGQMETANPYDPDENFDGYTSWFDGWNSIDEQDDE